MQIAKRLASINIRPINSSIEIVIVDQPNQSSCPMNGCCNAQRSPLLLFDLTRLATTLASTGSAPAAIAIQASKFATVSSLGMWISAKSLSMMLNVTHRANPPAKVVSV